MRSYNGVWTVLINAKTISEASNAVMLDFEKPADQSEANQEARAMRGQRFYEMFVHSGVPEGGGKEVDYNAKVVAKTGNTVNMRQEPT